MAFVNTADFWRPVLEMSERFIQWQFARPQNRALYTVVAEPVQVLVHRRDCI